MDATIRRSFRPARSRASCACARELCACRSVGGVELSRRLIAQMEPDGSRPIEWNHPTSLSGDRGMSRTAISNVVAGSEVGWFSST